ncbi:MAG: hypothetical protein COB23_06075 [Methylophaga sp.]|nr:MAG: hypothetical protein COB23_06075 [Methylophaga sp.]
MPVFDANKTTQKNITADKVAARDLIDNSINNNYGPLIYREDTILKELVEEHEKEILLDHEYKEFSDKLNNFLYRKVEGSLRDLNEKLNSGNRAHLVEMAMDLKESITKKIMKNSHFESAQKIYTHLLVQIRVTFQSEISSRVKSREFQEYEIDDLVVNKIIGPLLHSVEGCSLLIDKEDLYGLLYVLTGNCYIEWD